MSTAEPTEENFDALVEEAVYVSDDGRYAVLRAKRTAKDEVITMVGDLGGISAGETLKVHGRFTDHAVYGRRFRVAGFVPVLPNSAEGIARYLGSGMIPGVGAAMAARLVEKFGDRTLDIIATESARLREVPGFGAKRVEALSEAVRARRHEAQALSFLHTLGLGPALGRRIMKRLGEDTVRLVREDPYAVAEMIHGMGFRTADRVGRAAGIGPDDPRRAAGAVLHVLANAVDDGNSFLPADVAVQGAVSLGITEERAREAIGSLENRGLVIRDGEAVYAPPLYRAEGAVAKDLARLSVAKRRGGDTNIEPPAGIELAAKQLEAVRASLTERLVVLTGGPGTGKTTTVRAIVHERLRRGERVALCAPTGRAAKRLSDATGHEAKTIHRMLEWNPATGGFQRGRSAPIEAELVIVDEASMIDVVLAERLLAAVGEAATLMLVGDVDQLPPVGPGQVLRDTIASGHAHVVRLEEIFRQAQRSAIVRGAHAILHGEMPEPSPPGATQEGDLFIVRARDSDAILDRVVATLKRMKAAYGLDPRTDVQVLTPMRRGSLGTDELNLLLQKELNPAHSSAVPGAFRVGDKVMQLRNDYERDVYNGDVGTVSRIVGGMTFIMVDGRELQYSIDALDALTLAYACTIHKVQGSEFPAIMVVMHGSHHVLLSRALLYTAVTRAKRLVVIVGDDRALHRAVNNAASYDTFSRLRERIGDAVAKAETTAAT